VYCQNTKRATVFFKVGLPSTAKQHFVVSSSYSSLFVWGGGMGKLHVQQHTRSVFYPLLYLTYKAAKEWVGEWG